MNTAPSILADYLVVFRASYEKNLAFDEDALGARLSNFIVVITIKSPSIFHRRSWML
jgi:hypothetical protein